MKGLLSSVFKRVDDLWALPSDSDEERLHKAIVTLAALITSCAAFLWVAVYLLLGFWSQALIPLSYPFASALCLLVAYKLGRFDLFRFSHLLLMLLLPFALSWGLGGFAASGAVVLWSLWAPLGALMVVGIRQSVPWFAAYIFLLVVSGLWEAAVPQNGPNISPLVRTGFFVMDLGGISAFVYVLVSYFAIRRREALVALALKHKLLEAEQERSENLLLNILPASIAERLKRNPAVIADAFDEITVLFADIVGFTPMSARVEPEAMVLCLNEIFSRFDRLAERYGLEKIRTIGDSYMVVGGAPVIRPDHAEAVAGMALDMLSAVDGFKAPNGDDVRIRIGINTGPAIGAVLGVKKFVYDVYGDAVNTASRMESHGVAGSIQVSAATYELLYDRYVFEPRGSVQVKGKGEMTTYLLLGRVGSTGPSSSNLVSMTPG